MHLAITTVAPEGGVAWSIFVMMRDPFCFLTTFVVWVADAAMSASPFCLRISSAASVNCTHLLAAQNKQLLSACCTQLQRCIQQQTFYILLMLWSNMQDMCSLTLREICVTVPDPGPVGNG